MLCERQARPPVETAAEAPQGRGVRLALAKGVRGAEAWGAEEVAEAADRGRG